MPASDILQPFSRWKKLDEHQLRLTLFWVAMGLILFESLVFWKESLFYLDGAKVLFELIDEQWFSFMHNRFWMAVTQVLPLAAVRNGYDPLFIFYTQSLSFALPPLITLVAAAFLFRDTRAVVMVLFFIILGTNQIHYIKEWGGYGALYLLILFYSFFHRSFDPAKRGHLLAAAILIFLCINTHPTTVCFYLMIPLIHSNRFSKRLLAGYAAVVAVSFIFVISLNVYNDGKIAGASQFQLSIQDLINYGTYYVKSFPFFAMVIIFAVYLYRFRRVTARHVIALLIPLGFSLAVASSLFGISFNEFNFFYYETQFFLILAALLIFPLYKLLQNRFILILVFVIAAGRMVLLNYSSRNMVHENMQVKEALILKLHSDHPDKRAFVMHQDNALTMSGYPEVFPWYETYLLSSCLLEDPIVLYLTNDTTRFEIDGRPVYFYRAGAQKVDPGIPDTYSGTIDPIADFGSMDLKSDEIMAL